MREAIEIRRYSDVAQAAGLAEQLDCIFFESSNTKTFASEAARGTFRERWLGRYLRDEPELAFLAFDDAGRLAGYVLGSARPFDLPQLADAAEARNLENALSRFPAHLHINLEAGFRGRGLGGLLIEALVDALVTRGHSGLHVITSKGARNASFYRRSGFKDIMLFGAAERQNLLLGRAL